MGWSRAGARAGPEASRRTEFAQRHPRQAPTCTAGWTLPWPWHPCLAYQCLALLLLAGDVEERYVEMEEGRLVATPEKMRPLIDENTIGACDGRQLHAAAAAAAAWVLGWGGQRGGSVPSVLGRAGGGCRARPGLEGAAVLAAASPGMVPTPSCAAGVAAVFGSTYNGEFEDVAAIDALLTGAPPRCIVAENDQAVLPGNGSPRVAWVPARLVQPAPSARGRWLPVCLHLLCSSVFVCVHPCSSVPSSTELNEANGWDLKIHVDGASGAFVAPFLVSPGGTWLAGWLAGVHGWQGGAARWPLARRRPPDGSWGVRAAATLDHRSPACAPSCCPLFLCAQYPDLEWDFRLKNVASINASGHK